MNDKEINNKIDIVLKPFMIDDINNRLIEDGEKPIEKELLMQCHFETLDMFLSSLYG